MPSCTVCTHPKRLEIDRRIVSGANLANLAKEFGLPYSSTYNHAQIHVSRQLTQVMEKRATAEQFDLLERIDGTIIRAEKIFLRNFEKGRDLVALKALSEQRATFELLAKISYALHQAKQAEIELARLNSGEISQEDKQAFQKKLKVLTIPELEMLLALQEKLEKQDPSIEIIPDVAEIQSDYSPFLIEDKKEIRRRGRKEVEGPTRVRTIPPGGQEWEEMQVRKIEAVDLSSKGKKM